MSSSDTSSSDSDDEQMTATVTNAFRVMKQNLALANAGQTQQNKKFTNKHRLIYETFTQTSDCSNESNKLDDCDNDKVSSNTEFFIDKGPANQINDKTIDTEMNTVTINVADDVSTDDSEDVDQEDHNKNKEKFKKKKMGVLSSELKTNLKTKDVYVNVDPLNKRMQSLLKKNQKEPEIMKKSVITDDFEKHDSIATTHTSIRQLKKQRKLEREKTKGGKWFNMPATEITEERKYDLSLLQMRKSLDPKRFYKANDLKTTPKYFQFGEVVSDATDFYSSRIPKKQRKSTIVEELLADAEFRKFNKRKYNEVQDAKRQGKGPYKHMKRLKKGKK